MKPFVSVIIPTYRREDLFFKCLGSLSQQDYPNDKFEVIAVYDGNDCPYDKAKLGSALKTIRNLQFFTKINGGAAKARNFAISKTRGSLILTIDDDCVAQTNWISSFVSYMSESKELIGSGGTVMAAPPKSYVQKYIAFKRLMYQPVRDTEGNIVTIITANACYKKEALDKVKGFDEEFPFSGGEDLDLSMRLRKYGNLGYSNKSIICHYHRSSLYGLIKQHYFYGKGVYIACKKNLFPYEKLKFYEPDWWGFVKYIGFIAKRTITVSLPEFWKKKLPLYNWIPYAILDIIRKLSFSIGATMEFYSHDSKRTA
jgi:GT2 family glycosyltransferase